jgi:hypothetical protein
MAQRINFFLPYLRQGITTLADHDTVPGKRMDIPVKLTISASGNEGNPRFVDKKITLLGPGDILGINSNVISRTSPPAHTTNFEAALSPFLQFSEPDFLWRFSSRRTGDKKNWIPWLCLIVLKQQDGQEEGEFVKAEATIKALPPQIQLMPNAILPDLKELWRWAHIHTMETDGSSSQQIANSIKAGPNKVACRLLSPRRLKPQTKYHAFLIPTFKVGAEAAMGIGDGVTDRTVLTWETPADGAGKTLPYYFDWEFSTGTRGDFENLVRKLTPRDLVEMGVRTIDCGNPGYGMDEASGLQLQMEAALKSLDTEYQAWGMDAPDGTNDLSTKKQEQLTNLLNKREEKINGETKIRVTPPVYGEWHASRQGEPLGPEGRLRKSWLDELNLDFRHRAAAGLGVQFVKENQETLMKAAWEQLSAIKKVNEELNVGRFGREVSQKMYTRIANMEPTQVLRIASPMKDKIAIEPSKTLATVLNTSNITANMLQLKSKKYFSKGGVARLKTTFTPVDTLDVVDRHFKVKSLKNILDLNPGTRPLPPVIAFKKIAWPEGIVDATISSLNPKNTIESGIVNRVGRFRQIENEVNGTAPDNTVDPLHPVVWHPEFHRPMYRFLRDLSQEHILPGLDKVLQNTIGLLQTNRRFIEAFMLGLNHEMASELRWREFPTNMRGSYFRSFWDTSIYSVDEAEKIQFRTTRIGIKLLADIQKQYGADFNTFPKIEEAYTRGDPSDKEKEIATAYETAIEKWLLTREEDKDIEKIADWGEDERLGDHPARGNPNNAEEDENRLVLLIRGELLLKFKNTLIYLVKNKGGKPDLDQEATRLFPVFEGELPPDIVFLGFPVKEAEGADYFVVFEERVNELRFGLDETPEGVEPGTGQNNFSWEHFPSLPPEGYLDANQPTIFTEEWNNAAFIGKVMLQKQVRAYVKLETLLPG